MKINMVSPENRRDRSSLAAVVVLIASLMVGLFFAPAQAAIVYINQSSGGNNALPTNGSAGSLTIPQPAGVSAGRALIASIAARPRSMTVTVPPGWILMTSTQQTAGGVSTAPGGMTLLTYYKIATASEPASYTWTFANPTLNQGGSAVGGILAFSGIDTSVSPIDVWSARLTPNGTTHATNSITPTLTNTMIVSSISFLSSSTFGNPSGITGITERLDVAAPPPNAAIGTTLQMSTAPWATATATGASQAVAASDADTGVGHLMALKPSLIDLDISMTRSGPLNPGGSASYTLTVINNGINTEPGPLTIVDTLPAGLTYTSSSGSGWTCSPSGQTITCSRASALLAGATAPALTLNVNVSAGASGTLTNTATVSGTGGDGNLANNTAIDSYTIPGSAAAGFCDDFESGMGNWLVSASGGDAGIGNQTSLSPSNSLFLRWGAVSVTSQVSDLSAVTGGSIQYWVRRGDDSFSEDPDNNEDLVVEYFTSTATWQVLETLPGNGTPGEQFTRNIPLPANARHAQFQLRFRYTSGSGADFDYWHVDDVCFGSATFPQPAPVAYYAMDELAWSGSAGEVIDGSGNGNHGVRVGVAQTIDPAPNPTPILPGNCRAGATVNNGDAINTSLDIDGGVGNNGTVTFWFRPNWTQSGAERNTARVLFDASMGNKYFKLAKLDNRNNVYPSNAARRRLALLFEDSADGDFVAYTTLEPNFVTNTWMHIAVTWNFPGDRFEIYIDGALAGSQTPNTNGAIAPLDTLYLGDERSGYNPYGVTTQADGAFDEVRVYATALTAAQITADMNAAHACVAVDHYELSMAATSLTCLATPVTVTACANSSSPCTSPYAPASGTTASLATSGGSLGSSTVTFNASGVATTTLSFPAAADGTSATVALSSEALPAANPRRCVQGASSVVANSCTTTFNTAGFIFSASAGGAAATIPAQVAGVSSSTFYLRAVRTSTTTQACEAALTGGNSVNFAYECNNPTTCSSTNLMSVNGGTATTIARNNNGSVSSYLPVNMTFDANGNAPFTFNYSDVGQTTLWATKAAGGSLLSALSGSSNAFVVKPDHFVLSNIVRTSDSFANPGAADQNGLRFIGAGENFTVTTTAVNALNNATPNYGKEIVPEGVRLTSILVAPVGGLNPAIGFTTGFGAFTNGAATGTDFNWNEVGIITLTPGIGDSNYLGAGDVSGTASGNVGRFTPAYFDITSVTPGCSTFTYAGLMPVGPQPSIAGQPFSVTATARNVIGVTTSNYRDFGGGIVFSKDTTISDAGTATNFTNNTLLAAGYSFGAGTDSTITYRFAAKESAPQTLTLRAVDADNVSSAGHVELTTVVRSGRVHIINTYGSELLDLPVPMRAEYYDATSGWITNANDGCTSVGLGSLTPVNPIPVIGSNPAKTTNASIANVPFAAGDAGLQLSAPMAGGSGYVDLTGNLSTNAWLQHDWNGTGTAGNPTGRATFGLYRGSSRHIYQRQR